MTQSMGPARRSRDGEANPKPVDGVAFSGSKLAKCGSERPITGGVQTWAKLLMEKGWKGLNPETLGGGGDGGAGSGGGLWGDEGAGQGRKGAGGVLEGQVRVGPAGPEGEGCLAMATITQLGWTVSFLLPDLLPASEGRGPFFELQREQ